MLEIIKFLAAAVGLFGVASSFAHGAAELPKFGITVRVPPSLFSKMGKTTNVESLEAGTQCLEFFTRRTKNYAGEFCASSDPEFLQERGIASYESLPSYARSIERPQSGLIAVSPVSQYSLESFLPQRPRSYAATIDCDEVNDPIYRPTSNCHVVVA